MNDRAGLRTNQAYNTESQGGRTAGWLDRKWALNSLYFMVILPTASKYSGDESLFNFMPLSVGGILLQRETDRKESRGRKRTKTKSKEVTRYAKSKQIYVVRRTGKWFLLKFY